MQVLVVIVNFQTARLVVDCLQSLADERSRHPGLRVAVVDNPGGDDSAAQLRSAIAANQWQDWVELLAMPRNGGFAYGVNAGVQPALNSPNPPDAFLLLNPDTYIRPGAVADLSDYLAAHQDVGMVGSRLEDADGTPQHSRFRFPSIATTLDEGLQLGIVTRLLGDRITCPPLVDTPHEIDWLSGACMLIRREVFAQVGPFDEGYFLYFEELDFSRRAHDQGFRSHYVPRARVVHLVGQSTGVTVRDRRPERRPGYWFTSRSRYYRKHHGRLYKLAADLTFVVARLGYHAHRLIRMRPDHEPPRFLTDFIRHNFWPGRSTAGDPTRPTGAN